MGLVYYWICEMDLWLPQLQLCWICCDSAWIHLPFQLSPPVPAVFLSMNDAIGYVLKGSMNGNTTGGAVLVPSQFGNGIYLSDEHSRVDFGNHQSKCFYDPDMCSQGVTFAIWIKGGPWVQKGYIFNTGANSKASKGNGNTFKYVHITNNTWATAFKFKFNSIWLPSFTYIIQYDQNIIIIYCSSTFINICTCAYMYTCIHIEIKTTDLVRKSKYICFRT